MITQLPVEIFVQIISFLSCDELLILTCVDKQTYRLMTTVGFWQMAVGTRGLVTSDNRYQLIDDYRRGDNSWQPRLLIIGDRYSLTTIEVRYLMTRMYGSLRISLLPHRIDIERHDVIKPLTIVLPFKARSIVTGNALTQTDRYQPADVIVLTDEHWAVYMLTNWHTAPKLTMVKIPALIAYFEWPIQALLVDKWTMKYVRQNLCQLIVTTDRRLLIRWSMTERYQTWLTTGFNNVRSVVVNDREYRSGSQLVTDLNILLVYVLSTDGALVVTNLAELLGGSVITQLIDVDVTQVVADQNYCGYLKHGHQLMIAQNSIAHEFLGTLRLTTIFIEIWTIKLSNVVKLASVNRGLVGLSSHHQVFALDYHQRRPSEVINELSKYKPVEILNYQPSLMYGNYTILTGV